MESYGKRVYDRLENIAKMAIEFSDLNISPLDYLLMKYYPRPNVFDEC